MNPRLSIVIPYYDEEQRDLFPLLSSINNQIGVELDTIEVLLVNDGNNNEIPDQFLETFSCLDIRVIYMSENKGPGAARQYGLDHAAGEYILFCDADDIVHSVGVIGAFLQEINQNHPDIITTPWLEEMKDETISQYIYIPHEDEATWMHGKVFRKAFLDYHDIRFHHNLRVHEDSYFLSIAFELTDNKRKIPMTSYVWKWRKNSITRQNGGAYTYNSIPTFHYAVAESFKDIEKRGLKERLAYKVIQMAAYTYFCTHQDHWLRDEVSAYRDAAEQSFVDHFYSFKEYFTSADEMFVREVYNQERTKSFANSIEVEPFHNWLERIGFINKQNKGE